jgi:hypothetical protein
LRSCCLLRMIYATSHPAHCRFIILGISLRCVPQYNERVLVEHISLFTPLESPVTCSGDEDIIPFIATTGFNAPCEPLRWKVEDFLTGFTGIFALPVCSPVTSYHRTCLSVVFF